MKSRRNISIVMLFVFLWSMYACLDPQSEEQPLTTYIQKGDSISKIAFDTLRAALLIAMDEKGIPGAVKFCSENALSITAVHASQGITIQRVAERTRNPQNKLDSLDWAQWKRYQLMKTNGDSLQSTAIEYNDKVVYYKPILLQPICASCHGDPAKGMTAALIATIDSLYPADKAKNFKPGDLRGMWKISFSK